MKQLRSIKKKAKAGFTLLEIMSALFISTAGLTSAFSLTVYLFHSSRWADRLQESTLAGESLFEELLGVEYEDLTNGNDGFHGYQRAWIVTSYDHYKIVDVTVSWEGIEGGNRNISMQSLFNEPSS
jgi:prepilin-type N-terminal cleavage/methylation domain-containing protein